MWRVFGGAVLVIAGIAAFIEVHTHRPLASAGLPTINLGGGKSTPAPSELSTTAYDLLRIGAWALVVVGVLLIVVGLIGYWGKQTNRHDDPA